MARQDAINDALERLYELGFTMEHSFSEHGPMGAEKRPWQDIIRNWVPVLISGYFGGLTHGLIRTAHAVRSFPKDSAASSLAPLA